jgi:hypothetical protein
VANYNAFNKQKLIRQKIMKKIILMIAFVAITSLSFGQAQKQLNIGFIGVNYEIPVATDITVAPAAGTDWGFNHLQIGVKGNYYFDTLFGLTEPWDVYAGVNAGYGIGLGDSNDSDFAFGLQVAGRWFWSDKWGVYVEAAFGNLDNAGGGIGVTMKL